MVIAQGAPPVPPARLGSTSSVRSDCGHAIGSLDECVEEQLERPVGLCPVLGSEADEENCPFTVFHRDDCRFVGNRLLTEEPAALQDIPVDIGHDPLDVRAARPGWDSLQSKKADIGLDGTVNLRNLIA